MEDLKRFAVHTMTTKPWPLETAIPEYAAQGVRGISIWKETLGDRDPRKVGALVRAASLEPVSLVRGGFFPAPGQEERAARIRDNERLVRTAAELGAPLLVLVCGAHPAVPIAEAREQVLQGIEAVLGTAEREGVRLAIEPLHPMYAGDRSVVNTIAQACDIVERLRSPALAVAVDVYHVWWDPDLPRQIRRCAALGALAAFHVCDWKVPLEDMLEDRGLMGEGCIDIPGIRAMVEGAGFAGFVEVEIFSRRHWATDQREFLSKIRNAFVGHV